MLENNLFAFTFVLSLANLTDSGCTQAAVTIRGLGPNNVYNFEDALTFAHIKAGQTAQAILHYILANRKVLFRKFDVYVSTLTTIGNFLLRLLPSVMV